MGKGPHTVGISILSAPKMVVKAIAVPFLYLLDVRAAQKIQGRRTREKRIIHSVLTVDINPDFGFFVPYFMIEMIPYFSLGFLTEQTESFYCQ